MREARSRLSEYPILPVSDAVVEAHARLRADCQGAGHALAAHMHMGDAWVAATAIGFGLPLLSGDSVFMGAPGLALVSTD